jgi:pentatricopeptide repeat protein
VRSVRRTSDAQGCIHFWADCIHVHRLFRIKGSSDHECHQGLPSSVVVQVAIDQGIELDERFFTVLLGGLCQAGMLDKAWEVFRRMQVSLRTPMCRVARPPGPSTGV